MGTVATYTALCNTRNRPAISGTGTFGANIAAARNRTTSRRARPSAVSPATIGIMHPNQIRHAESIVTTTRRIYSRLNLTMQPLHRSELSEATHLKSFRDH
ncbi:hypothetical protein GCM10022251_34690 [Phytohabitans flavus]|uniref:Uncharacterized protein n=2 Tax=Phytohabitans flavus TaxID=1076124 RepID=A0A6F8XMX1_9ACTN|nr:hypothetical protein Pflav_015820 [Phytohabitans flavus]